MIKFINTQLNQRYMLVNIKHKITKLNVRLSIETADFPQKKSRKHKKL